MPFRYASLRTHARAKAAGRSASGSAASSRASAGCRAERTPLHVHADRHGGEGEQHQIVAVREGEVHAPVVLGRRPPAAVPPRPARRGRAVRPARPAAPRPPSTGRVRRRTWAGPCALGVLAQHELRRNVRPAPPAAALRPSTAGSSPRPGTGCTHRRPDRPGPARRGRRSGGPPTRRPGCRDGRGSAPPRRPWSVPCRRRPRGDRPDPECSRRHNHLYVHPCRIAVGRCTGPR